MSRALRQAVYDHVCEQILTGARQAGERLSELTLAKETGVSRSPVREAIGQLRAEGILEQVPGYGAFIKTPTREELADAFEVREWLEVEAISSLAASPDRSTAMFAEARRAHEEMNTMLRESYLEDTRMLSRDRIDEFARIDMAWHNAILEAAGNRQVVKIIRDTRLLIHAAGCKPVPLNPDHVARVFAEHDLVLRAVIRGDASEARRLLAEHIRWGQVNAMGLFDGTLPEPEAGVAPTKSTGVGPGPRF